MDTQLVTLGRDNIRLFASLYLAVFNAPPWNDGWEENAVRERLHAFAEFPEFRGMGVLVSGEPAALVFGWGERWVKGWTFHVKEMCVSGAFQRQGLGRQLLSALEPRLAAEGFLSTNLQTGEAAPARAFYESLGYRKFAVVSLNKRLLP